jgi:aminopeptidase N
MVQIPSYKNLSQKMEVVDVEALCAARKFVRDSLALSLKDIAAKIYQENNIDKLYEYNVAAVGERAIKRASLSLLATADYKAALPLITKQLSCADNMTDEQAALSILVNLKGDDKGEKEKALDSFYQKWKKYDLIINSWFASQASVDAEGTYDKVLQLMEHKDFSFKNPNRLRSLFGGFFSNFAQFHHESGRGYKLCIDQVGKLDQTNPQVAARILRVMGDWKRMDTKRQGMMKTELERLQKTSGLSSDTGELVNQILK